MLGLAAEKDKLTDLQTKLDVKRAERTKLEKQRATLNDLLEQVARHRPALVKAHSAGDTNAAKRLNDLDSEALALRRSLEGVEINLAENAAEIAPIEAELARETATAATEERRKQFEALTQRASARQKKLDALHREMTETFVALHSDLVDLRDEYPDFLGGNEAQRIYDLTDYNTRTCNEGWIPARKFFANGRVIQIRPMLAPK
jgi:chromosome segregation ATPase